MGKLEQAAFVNGIQRHVGGMRFDDAMRGMFYERGRPVPDMLLG